MLVLHGNHPDAGGWIMREWTTFDKQVDAWGSQSPTPTVTEAAGRTAVVSRRPMRREWTMSRSCAIIDWSAERHGRFPDRAVVAGVSNGAFIAHRTGLEAGDRVVVIATVAGMLPASLSDVTTTQRGVRDADPRHGGHHLPDRGRLLASPRTQRGTARAVAVT